MADDSADVVIYRKLAPGVHQFFFRVCGSTSEVMVSQRRVLQLVRDMMDGCDLGKIGD